MRENSLIFLCAVLILSLCLPPVSLGSDTNANTDADEAKLYGKAVKCRDQLTASTPRTRKEAHWRLCISKYSSVYRLNDKTRFIKDILINIGDLYLGLYSRSRNERHLRSALGSYRELYYHHPMNKWAPKATFKAGDIYFKDLKKYKLAYGAYKRLLQFYGSSRFATTARDRLRKLSIYYTPPPQKNKDQSALAAVNNIRHWTGPRYTRVVIDLTRRVPYSNEVIKTPDRLFIDLDRARVSKKLKGQSITISDGLLKRVRVAQYTRDTVRVVLDIDRIESYKIIELDNPFRVIIDVNSKAKKKRKAVAVKAKTKKSDSNGKLSLAKQLGLGIETIVIDPGHGGKDPGAIGRKGAMEKDIVLDIAKKLKKIIEKGTGRRAYLTRYTDVFVPLEERTAIANTREADLFVSLHVNANSLSSVRGLETYYLSLATTREEREIAARENQTSFKKIRDLQKILESMLLNSKKEESRDLAHHMQSALITGLKSNYQVRDLGVKKAPFHVLIGAQMPSILTEISFITNPKDEKMLTTNRYRQAVALEIFHGLESYIASMKAHPNTASR